MRRAILASELASDTLDDSRRDGACDLWNCGLVRIYDPLLLAGVRLAPGQTCFDVHTAQSDGLASDDRVFCLDDLVNRSHGGMKMRTGYDVLAPIFLPHILASAYLVWELR